MPDLNERAVVEDARRRIQDLLAAATGRSLPADAQGELDSILQSLSRSVVAPVGETYSHRHVTILFADLRGFAAIAEAYPVHVVLDVLNRCFSAMTDIIFQHYGTIDKFMGDAIMAVFAGDQDNPLDHARRAVLCAVEMQLAMNELRSAHQAENVPEMFLGIGINTGKVMAGMVGSERYRAHTVIGEEVNLASRIEAFSLRGQVLISDATHSLCQDFAETSSPVLVHVKGKAQEVSIREVTAIPSLGKFIPRQEVRRSPRVEVLVPLIYHLLDDKVVLPKRLEGTIRDIGYHGLLAEVAQPIPLYQQIKLEIDLVILGYRADDIYGRVVNIRRGGGKMLVGIEFTSLGDQTKAKLELFVQMLIQKWLVGPRFAWG
jgi:adenylate cyclase